MYEVLFQYGPITIKSFNLLLAVAFIVGPIFLIRCIRLKKLSLSFFVDHLAHFLIFSLLGGRLFYIFENLSLFKNPLRVFYIWDFGFSAFGVFYAAILTLYFLTHREKRDFWAWLDTFTLSGLAGLFFIQIGHFLNGSHYGTPTTLPWGISFDAPNISFTTPIHPTQLYSALIIFIIFAISVRSVKRTHLTGVVGSLAIMLYSLSAFLIDFLHNVSSLYIKSNYLVIAALAFIFYIHCYHKKLSEQPQNS